MLYGHTSGKTIVQSQEAISNPYQTFILVTIIKTIYYTCDGGKYVVILHVYKLGKVVIFSGFFSDYFLLWMKIQDQSIHGQTGLK